MSFCFFKQKTAYEMRSSDWISDVCSSDLWLFSTFLRTLAVRGMPHLENWRADRGAPVLSKSVLKDTANRDNFTWDHIREARDFWKGNLIVKGILSTSDARLCADIGVDGIVVSNNGGRQVEERKRKSLNPSH